MYIGEIGWDVVEWMHLAQEHGNGPIGFIKDGEFLD
jgi:hypothetical protein